MSTPGSENGSSPSPSEWLVVVRVEDAIDPTLTGHAADVYESPPQPREQAMALVRLVLGRVGDSTDNDAERWTAAVAGGQRIVTLSHTGDRPVSSLEPWRRVW